MNDTERTPVAEDAHIEAVAKAIRIARQSHESEYMNDFGELAIRGGDNYTEQARAALQAAALEPEPDAAGDDLDAMLNNIHPNATASLQFIQPYLTTDPEPYWQAHVSVPTGGLTGFQKHRGTGPTRMAAIQDAVRQATGAEGERE